ncbi:MAG: alcohol dehydrogenase catalytic domain-containing protein [Desulfobacteraceae bacterium]
MGSVQIRLYADEKPIAGVAHPGPNQIYQHPFVRLEKSVPGPLKEEDIRVEMLYAGLCGTDIHLIETNRDTGYIKSSAPLSIPANQGRRIGHEGVGRVIETGRMVRHIRPGSYVTFESIIVCHYCDVCRKGHFNQCRNASLLGLQTDGLFGNIVDVPSMLAHDITGLVKTEADLKALACVEPAGVAYVACQNTRIKGGDNVIIFGAGPIGIFSAILSKTIFGASNVHIVEPLAFRREFAGQWADHVYDPSEFRRNPPSDIDVAIEASGEIDNINTIFKKINPNGRIALLARSGEPFQISAVDHMITNAISLIGSRGHLCGAFSDIMTLYRQNRIPLGEVVTLVIDDIEGLCSLLDHPGRIIQENCKVLACLKK